MVSCAENDIKPLLRVDHISSLNYADYMFESAFLMWMGVVARFWGTYMGSWEHNMVGPCSVEDAQPNTVLTICTGKYDTVVSMMFFKARCLEVRERGYSIVQGFVLNMRFSGH